MMKIKISKTRAHHKSQHIVLTFVDIDSPPREYDIDTS